MQADEITVCPLPIHWHLLHQRLTEISSHRRLPPPPIPLVLAGWNFSSDIGKQARWLETIEWAKRVGLEHELSELSPEAMYRVSELSSWVPYGNHTYGGHAPRQKLSQAERARICDDLRSHWPEIVGEPIASRKIPLRLIGRKGRRLLVQADEAFQPPWGTWFRLSGSRSTFTAFRASINAHVAPSHIDHVDFVLLQARNS